MFSHRARAQAALLAWAAGTPTDPCDAAARAAAAEHAPQAFVLPSGDGATRVVACASLRAAMAADGARTWIRLPGIAGIPASRIVPAQLAEADADCRPGRDDLAVWQSVAPGFRIRGCATSLRAYLLVASVSPLVAFVNFDAGHVFVDSENEARAFKGKGVLDYEAHAHVAGFVEPTKRALGGDLLTSLTEVDASVALDHFPLEELDDWIGEEDFTESKLKPQMKAVLAAYVFAAAADTADSDDGVLARSELFCADFVLSGASHVPQLVDVTRGCAFAQYSEREPVKARLGLVKDAVELALEVHGRLLRDAPLGGLLDGDGAARGGEFELLAWDASAAGPASFASPSSRARVPAVGAGFRAAGCAL